MIQIRKANERGHLDFGWLDTYHTFSFGEYHDEKFMGFRSLRVINDDRVQKGVGFPTHPHRNMEIITYILDGALEHKDSMGTGSVIRPGDVQLMTAGSGVTHSEFNPSKKDPVHLLQIWILPNQNNLKPGYQQKSFSEKERSDQLRLLVSPDGQDGSLTIHQDARLFASLLNKGKRVEYDLKPGRHAWIQVAKGELTLNGKGLKTGDGAAISDEARLTIEAGSPTEFLLFDLA